MILIILGKFRKKPSKERLIEATKATNAVLEKAGGKRLGTYFTLGRYDYVTIVERPDAGVDFASTISRAMEISDEISSETLVAVNSQQVLDLMK